METAHVTGVVLTKLDGTAKGGVVVAIKEELGLDVKWIGIGEGMMGLPGPFDPKCLLWMHFLIGDEDREPSQHKKPDLMQDVSPLL